MNTEIHSLQTKLVGIIDFHGITLTVIEHDSIKYIKARALVETAGIDWKGARRALFNADNPKLYGTSELLLPKTDDMGKLASPKKAVYIRLDRSQLYLARIDTGQMRAQGNAEAADSLLELQIEWALVLHDYETKGVAINLKGDDLVNEVYKLDRIKDPSLKQICAARINDKFGVDIPIGNQQTLPM